ncbi:DUF7935 family protein [Salinimicrobium gaetbulicola]|uniref:Uncharacterized protein n=1 Tax=Salinimicrobium gaetbulicola TaxID=999702 RepID=A0ABW3ID45_9FLAO
MTEESILQLLFYLLPAVVVGVVAFYFFSLHVRNDDKRRRYLLHRENQKQALPLRLQAYERMALFLERVAPGNLLVRVRPYSDDKIAYANLLVKTIEQEFEHNLAQQIYVSEECWNVIKASKNATINNIRKTAAKDEIEDADQLRQQILNALLDQQPPSETGLSFIKKEVKVLW